MSDRLFQALLILLCLAPLPFGSHRPWAWSLLSLLVGLLLCAWGYGVLRNHVRLAVPLRAVAPVLILSGSVLVWATVQAVVPFSAPFAHPLWAEAAAALGQKPHTAAISLDPAATWGAIQRCLTYGGIFWLALQLGRDRERAYLGLHWLARAAVLYAVYGLILFFAGVEAILWFPKWAYLGDLTSTFVNRNAFATYAGLGLLLCLALAIHALYRATSGGRQASADRRLGLRDRVSILITEAGTAVVGIILLGTAILLSHSRGGFMATAISMILLILAAATAGLIARKWATLLLAGMLTLGTMLVIVSGEATLERIAESNELEGERGFLFSLTSDAIGDAPWTGHGFGAYLASFKPYRSADLGREVLFDYAHSMPLEQAMELGIPAALLWLAALVLILVRCTIGLVQRRRSQIHPALAIAAAGLLITHNLFDFSLANPAISALAAYLTGVGLAQSWPSGDLIAPVTASDPTDSPAGTAAHPMA